MKRIKIYKENYGGAPAKIRSISNFFHAYIYKFTIDPTANPMEKILEISLKSLLKDT